MMPEELQRKRLLTKLHAEQKAIAARSLQAFARVYLPHWVKHPDSRLHKELYPRLTSLPQRPGARLAIAAPRGSAKSTLVSQAFVLWSICYRHYPYIVLISDTAEKAADFLSHIKDELVGNEALAAGFPEVCEPGGRYPRPPRWRSDEIITRNGVKITAMGVGQNIRGRRHRQDRPSLIILDDSESPENAATPEGRARFDSWFHKSILKAGTPDTRVIVVGTIVHYDALLARLTDAAKSPAWESRVYRSVRQWSAHPELWETWASILRGREEFLGDTGPVAARTFFESQRELMLEGTEVLWPQVEDYYTLMAMRETEGPAAFDSEKQNEPVNPADCLFLETEYVFWDDEHKTEEALLAALDSSSILIGACDPSLGRLGKHADDSAIITLLRDAKTGTLYVLDADIARRKPDKIIEDVLSYCSRTGYCAFGFETNQFQSFLADELTRRGNAMGCYPPVYRIQNTTDKLGRIQSLQPLIRSGTIRFCRRHRTLLDQLRHFPKAAHDDGPDALEMAVRLAIDLSRPAAPSSQVAYCTPAFADLFLHGHPDVPDWLGSENMLGDVPSFPTDVIRGTESPPGPSENWIRE